MAQLLQLQADAEWVGADLETCIERLERTAFDPQLAEAALMDTWPDDSSRLSSAASPQHPHSPLQSMSGAVCQTAREQEQEQQQQQQPPGAGIVESIAAQSHALDEGPAPRPREMRPFAELGVPADEGGAVGPEGALREEAAPQHSLNAADAPAAAAAAAARPAASRLWVCLADSEWEEGEGGGEGGAVEVTLRQPEAGAECPITLGPMAEAELEFLPGVHFFDDEPRLREVPGPGHGGRPWGP